MNKTKLLIVSSTFPRYKNDNIPLFVYELALNLRNDFEVHVLAPHYKNIKVCEEMEGIVVHRFIYFFPQWEILTYKGGGVNNLKKNKLVNLLIPFYAFFNFFAMLRLLIKFHFKVINVHWLIPSGFLALILKPFFNFKLIITSHGGDIYGFQKSKIIGKAVNYFIYNALKYADHITVVSQAIKDECKKRFNSLTNLDDKISVIAMGIDTKKFISKTIQKNLDINKEVNLLFVGRLVEKKGVTYLIESIALLKQRGIKVVCNIAGDGPERNILQELTLKLKIEKNINFLGYVNNDIIPELLIKNDIFIGPSIKAKGGDSEGSPTTYKEAMISRIPLIVTNIEGIDELVINKVNGIIVPQKDPLAIATAVEEYLSNPMLVNNVIYNGFNKGMEYEWKDISKKFVTLFTK